MAVLLPDLLQVCTIAVHRVSLGGTEPDLEQHTKPHSSHQHPESYEARAQERAGLLYVGTKHCFPEHMTTLAGE